jgi:bifunctional non-homologous end joining protein LigD
MRSTINGLLKIRDRPQQEFVVRGFTGGLYALQDRENVSPWAKPSRCQYVTQHIAGINTRVVVVVSFRTVLYRQTTGGESGQIAEKIQWVAPRLVCEVASAEWTEGGQLRQTTLLGWRDDKNSEEVTLTGRK